MNALHESLINARALIADPEHWTQGSHAIENTGMDTDPLGDEAYAFCADGACARIAGGFDSYLYAEMIRALDKAAGRVFDYQLPWAIVRINDCEVDFIETNDAAYAAVMKLFDDAIAHAA